MSVVGKACGPSKWLHLTPFDQQKLRGALTSVVSGGSSNLLYMALVGLGNMNPVVAGVVALQIIGGFISYSLDIVFAKHFFNGVKVPYTHLGFRTKYLFKSFFTEMVLRFIVSVIIISITYFFMCQSWIKFAEENKLTFKGYKIIYPILINAALYFLFAHVILFDYVYMETERPIEIDITMIGIMIVCLLMYCAWNISSGKKLEKEANRVD